MKFIKKVSLENLVDFTPESEPVSIEAHDLPVSPPSSIQVNDTGSRAKIREDFPQVIIHVHDYHQRINTRRDF